MTIRTLGRILLATLIASTVGAAWWTVFFGISTDAISACIITAIASAMGIVVLAIADES